MKIFYLLLVLLAVSCASERRVAPAPVAPAPIVSTPAPIVTAPAPAPEPALAEVSPRAESPPAICDFLVTAINHGDWPALQPWARPGTSAIELISSWETAAKAGHPVKVGKFLNMQTVGGTTKKPYKLFSYSLENKDGTVNPHWIQIKVREDEGKSEIIDFWNFGW